MVYAQHMFPTNLRQWGAAERWPHLLHILAHDRCQAKHVSQDMTVNTQQQAAKHDSTAPDMRSTTTTVTLSRLPRSTAALVRTVAAMRAADWRVAPLCLALRRQRFARLHASWLVSTSHRPSLARSSSSSSGLRAKMVICTGHIRVRGRLWETCFEGRQPKSASCADEQLVCKTVRLAFDHFG